MKTVHLLIVTCILAGITSEFAAQTHRRSDDVLVFSTLMFVKHSQYPPDVKVSTFIQSSAGIFRVDIDNFSFLATSDGLVLLDTKHRRAIRIKGANVFDVFYSLSGALRKPNTRTVHAKVTGYAYHLGYRCRIIQRQVEEEGVRSTWTEWVTRIGNKDIVLRRVETTPQWYAVQEAYQIASGTIQKWLTIPRDYSVQTSSSISEALQMITANSD